MSSEENTVQVESETIEKAEEEKSEKQDKMEKQNSQESEESEKRDDAEETTQSQMSSQEIEKLEEAKLKAKYPVGISARPMGGHSAFLQKRLTKGQKYFDSGDYQMAKQKTGVAKARVPPGMGMGYQVGEAIPTPESVPMRKTSIIQQSKLTHSNLT